MLGIPTLADRADYIKVVVTAYMERNLESSSAPKERLTAWKVTCKWCKYELMLEISISIDSTKQRIHSEHSWKHIVFKNLVDELNEMA